MSRPLPLVIGGALILNTAAGMSFLSHSFVFGVGHTERPILLLLVLYGLGCVATWWAFLSIRPEKPELVLSKRMMWILGVSLLARLFLFSSTLVQETDPYRYLWDGNAVLHGVNPYRYAPSQIDSVVPSTPREEAWQASTRTEEGYQVFSRINHPGVRTVYPPLAQGLFALAQWLTPWSLLGWRFLVLAADLINMGLILSILARARLPMEWSLLYGWSPLILKEFGNSLHLDVFVVLALLLMIHALQRDRIHLAFVTLALGGLVKLAPLALLVPLAGWVWRRSARYALEGMTLSALILLAGYLPVASAGWQVFAGLRRFLGTWRVNEGVYGLLVAIVPEPAGRWIVWLTVGLLSIGGTWWLMHGPMDLRRVWVAMLGVLTGLFLLMPTGNPWYFTWTFPFLTLVPVRTLLWLSGALGLYYLDFYFLYRGVPHLFQWVRIVEYGSMAVVGAWEFLRWRRSRSFCRSSTSAIALAAS